MTRRALTPQRFNRLIEAYGANAQRWPESERHAMLDFMADHPRQAEAALAQGREVDRWLDHLVCVPQAAVITPKPRRAALLWTGMGIAACLAGVAIGIELGLASMSEARSLHLLDEMQISAIDY